MALFAFPRSLLSEPFIIRPTGCGLTFFTVLGFDFDFCFVAVTLGRQPCDRHGQYVFHYSYLTTTLYNVKPHFEGLTISNHLIECFYGRGQTAITSKQQTKNAKICVNKTPRSILCLMMSNQQTRSVNIGKPSDPPSRLAIHITGGKLPWSFSPMSSLKMD